MSNIGIRATREGNRCRPAHPSFASFFAKHRAHRGGALATGRLWYRDRDLPGFGGRRWPVLWLVIGHFLPYNGGFMEVPLPCPSKPNRCSAPTFSARILPVSSCRPMLTPFVPS